MFIKSKVLIFFKIIFYNYSIIMMPAESNFLAARSVLLTVELFPLLIEPIKADLNQLEGQLRIVWVEMICF